MEPHEPPTVSPPRPAVTEPVAEHITAELLSAFALWISRLHHNGPRSLAHRGTRPH